MKLLPAHAGDLLEYLQAHPEALTSGAATGPSALRRLLDVLAAEHPGVQRMRCHGCGAQERSRTAGTEQASAVTVTGGRIARFACAAARQGSPRSVRAAASCAAAAATATPPASMPARGCGTMARVAYRVDGQPLCQTCGPRKLYTCSSCGRDNRPAHAFTSARTALLDLLPPQPRTRVRAVWPHHGGGPRRRPRRRTMDLQPLLGSSDDDVQQVRSRQALCEGKHLRPPGVLNVPSRCKPSKNVRPVRADRSDPDHTAARTGVRTLLPAATAQSGDLRQLSGNPPAGRHQWHRSPGLRPLLGDDRNWVCGTCGRVDLLFAACECIACSVKRRVRELLTGPDGQIPAQLDGVATFLLTDRPFEQTHHLFNGTEWMRLLGDLVAAGRPITHEILDDLPQGNHVRHLRSILVHTGGLDDQGDGLESLQPWLKTFLAGVSPQAVKLLRPYASWSVLPRARHRAARRGITASAPAYARDRIGAAAHFLTWLEHNHRTLADATQHDVNTWLGQGASTRHRIRDFLRWAHARGLAADLQVHWLGSEGLPEQVLGDDERWTLLRRCLRDDGLDLRLRVAGALVLLYGQIPSRIVELTIDSVTTTETDTYLVLRNQPVLLPPPLAALTVELAAVSSQEQSTTLGGSNPDVVVPGRATRLPPSMQDVSRPR